MHVAEMMTREPYQEVLFASLERGLSAQGVAQAVAPSGRQRWWYQPFFSAYHSDAPASVVKRWLRDSMRFTPVHWRLPLQVAAGTLAARTSGLRLLRRPGFALTPGVESPNKTLIVPGNQRIRMMCFETGTTRSWCKEGFSQAGMSREIEARQTGHGPFLPIKAHGEDWLEEELVEGYSLPRVPPWFRTRRPLAQLLRDLDGWSQGGASIRDSAQSYAHALAAETSQLASQVTERFGWEPDLTRPVERLIRAVEVSGLGEWQRTRTHGDLQAGNILVRYSGDLVLIDWEHSGVRSWCYDRLVFGLGTRAGGWRGRSAAFLAGSQEFPFEPLPPDPAWRKAALSLFCLEELLWYLREALTGPYLRVPQGLDGFARSLRERSE